MTDTLQSCRHADLLAALSAAQISCADLVDQSVISAAGLGFICRAAADGVIALEAEDSGRCRDGVDLRHGILSGATWLMPPELAARIEGQAAARQQKLDESGSEIARKLQRNARQADRQVFLRLAKRAARANAVEWSEMLRVMLGERLWLTRNEARSIDFLTQMQQRFDTYRGFTPSEKQLKWLCEVTSSMQRALECHMAERGGPGIWTSLPLS